MDYDYSKRGYLLPEGCKDLIDVIEPKPRPWFTVTVRLPEVKSGDLEIFAEGKSLHIVGKQAGSQIPFENWIEVPSGYEPAAARTIYIKGTLRVTIPKG